MNKNINLTNKNWQEFTFENIFEISSTSSGIDKNKLAEKSGNIPYITRSDKNNGMDMFVGKQDEKYQYNRENVITIGLDTQTVFYQPSYFYTGQNIQILANQHINKYIALFLVPLIERQMEKFNWGGNGATLTRLKRSKVFLPTTLKGIPDYDFMEAYMRQKEQEKLKKYQAYVAKRLNQLGGGNAVVPLEQKQWKEFTIREIFTIKSGSRLTRAYMQKGNKPFIGATDGNNGITTFVSNVNDSEDSNVLGVNYNGSVVENFYHPYKAIFSDDVKRLSFKNIDGSEYLFLFIKNQILKQKVKFQYGYKFNAHRMGKQKIMLPINNQNEPDYSYMKNYIKQLEYKKLVAYCEYKGYLTKFKTSQGSISNASQ